MALPSGEMAGEPADLSEMMASNEGPGMAGSWPAATDESPVAAKTRTSVRMHGSLRDRGAPSWLEEATGRLLQPANPRGPLRSANPHRVGHHHRAARVPAQQDHLVPPRREGPDRKSGE